MHQRASSSSLVKVWLIGMLAICSELLVSVSLIKTSGNLSEVTLEGRISSQ